MYKRQALFGGMLGIKPVLQVNENGELIPTEKIRVIQDYGALVDACLQQDAPVYIMPTYTAMLALREKISRTYGFKEFWE